MDEDYIFFFEMLPKCKDCGKMFINDQFLLKHKQKKHSYNICFKGSNNNNHDCLIEKDGKDQLEKQKLPHEKLTIKTEKEIEEESEIEVFREPQQNMEDIISKQLKRINKQLRNELKTAIKEMNDWIRNEFKNLKQRFDIPLPLSNPTNVQSTAEALKNLSLPISIQDCKTAQMYKKLLVLEEELEKRNLLDHKEKKTECYRINFGNKSLKSYKMKMNPPQEENHAQKGLNKQSQFLQPKSIYLDHLASLENAESYKLRAIFGLDFLSVLQADTSELKTALKTLILFAYKDFMLRTQLSHILFRNKKPSPEMTEQELGLCSGIISSVIVIELLLKPMNLELQIIPTKSQNVATFPTNKLGLNDRYYKQNMQIDAFFNNGIYNRNTTQQDNLVKKFLSENLFKFYLFKSPKTNPTLSYFLQNPNYFYESNNNMELYYQRNIDPFRISEKCQEHNSSSSIKNVNCTKPHAYNKESKRTEKPKTFIKFGKHGEYSQSKTCSYFKSIPEKLTVARSFWIKTLSIPCKWLWKKMRFNKNLKTRNKKLNIKNRWTTPKIKIAGLESLAPSSLAEPHNTSRRSCLKDGTQQNYFSKTKSLKLQKQFSQINNSHEGNNHSDDDRPSSVQCAVTNSSCSSSNRSQCSSKAQQYREFIAYTSTDAWTKNNCLIIKKSSPKNFSCSCNNNNLKLIYSGRTVPNPSCIVNSKSVRKDSHDRNEISSSKKTYLQSPQKYISPNMVGTPFKPKRGNFFSSILKSPNSSRTDKSSICNNSCLKASINSGSSRNKENNVINKQETEQVDQNVSISHIILNNCSFVSINHGDNSITVIDKPYTFSSPSKSTYG